MLCLDTNFSFNEDFGLKIRFDSLSTETTSLQTLRSREECIAKRHYRPTKKKITDSSGLKEIIVLMKTSGEELSKV